MNLNVVRLVTGPFQENAYIIWQENSNKSLFIDPGSEPEKLVDAVEEHGFEPQAIINTHAHLDHIGAVRDLQSTYSIPFYLHSNEKVVLNEYARYSSFFGLGPKPAPEVDHWFKEGQLMIGEFKIELFSAPGHTPGGTCLIIHNHVFTGDTLFAGSIGRTDLPGGNWETLNNSLIRIMQVIPSDFVLHPGHGNDTTLRVEMEQNPFLLPLLNRVNSLK